MEINNFEYYISLLNYEHYLHVVLNLINPQTFLFYSHNLTHIIQNFYLKYFLQKVLNAVDLEKIVLH